MEDITLGNSRSLLERALPLLTSTREMEGSTSACMEMVLPTRARFKYVKSPIALRPQFAWMLIVYCVCVGLRSFQFGQVVEPTSSVHL